VVVPDGPDLLTQHIDVRDLATWIVDAAETGLSGTYDGIGPAGPLPDLLRDIAAAVGTDVELVPITPDALVAAGVKLLGRPEVAADVAAADPRRHGRPRRDTVAGRRPAHPALAEPSPGRWRPSGDWGWTGSERPV